MKLTFGITTIIALSLAVLLGIQYGALAKLRRENTSLQSRLDEMSVLAAENEQLSNSLVQLKTAHTATSNQLSELLRLRGEVGNLRQKTNQLAKLQQENRQLQTARRETPKPPASHYTPPAPSEQSDFPKYSWTFAGYATPDAAYQSLLWAQLKADKEKFFQSLTPEKRQQVETMLERERQKGISEEQLKAQNESQFARISGFQILGREVLAEDQIRLQVSMGGREIHPVLKKIENEWKIQNMD